MCMRRKIKTMLWFPRKRTIIFVIVTSLTVYVSEAKINFRVTNFHTCLHTEFALYNINRISIQQCVEECISTSECSAVCYKRRFKLCEIYISTSIPVDVTVLAHGACEYIKREHIYVDTSEEDGIVCEPNPCRIKFCPAIELKNGYLRGNIRAVGSRVEFVCQQLFKEGSGVTNAVCHSNGIWTHSPACIQSYTYVGCFEDRQDRILNDLNIRPSLLTTEMCLMRCFESEIQYRYALTEAGYACFCGDILKDYPQKSENDCNTPCQGNTSQICGGYWRGSLYERG